jgi:hypothetical protein
VYAQAADTKPSLAKEIVNLKDAPSVFPMRIGDLCVPDVADLVSAARRYNDEVVEESKEG